MLRSACLEPGVNAVGAFDDDAINVIRIGATAACRIAIDAEFGLDIADDGVMGEYATIDLGKTCVVDIKPVEVTVENESDRSGLSGRQAFDDVQCRQVAVEATENVQRFGLDGRQAGDGFGAVAVSQRATAG